MEKSQESFSLFVSKSVDELKNALEVGDITLEEYGDAVRHLTGDA